MLAHLVHLETWIGNLDAAERLAVEHLAIAEQGGLGGQGAQARYNVAYTLAHRGRLDEARAMLVELRDDPATGIWDRHRTHGALGFVALSAGDPTTAIEHLDAWDEMLRAMHFGEPGYSRSYLDRLCALVGVGRTDDASVFADELQVQADRSGRASAATVALTGRALVAAHSDRLVDAQRMLDDAIGWYDRSPLRFDRARTLLLAGQVHRRAKAKARARDALVEAKAEFVSFGATAWVARTADELARVNVRPRASNELTETERQVALLAAGGLTNREVAARSFLAVKTVEANLAPRVPKARHPFTRRARYRAGERVAASRKRSAEIGGDDSIAAQADCGRHGAHVVLVPCSKCEQHDLVGGDEHTPHVRGTGGCREQTCIEPANVGRGHARPIPLHEIVGHTPRRYGVPTAESRAHAQIEGIPRFPGLLAPVGSPRCPNRRSRS